MPANTQRRPHQAAEQFTEAAAEEQNEQDPQLLDEDVMDDGDGDEEPEDAEDDDQIGKAMYFICFT